MQINYVAENISKYSLHINFEMENAFWAGLYIDSNVRIGAQGGIIFRERRDGQFRIGGQVNYGTATLTQSQGLGFAVLVSYAFEL